MGEHITHLFNGTAVEQEKTFSSAFSGVWLTVTHWGCKRFGS